mmetsp:Transcript_15074/g.22802  ORF Transcript_15074/g.22802 Transcript_15074/m.22802 type:complete len:97 (+) Transcript_15074:51-341(+)
MSAMTRDTHNFDGDTTAVAQHVSTCQCKRMIKHKDHQDDTNATATLAWDISLRLSSREIDRFRREYDRLIPASLLSSVHLQKGSYMLSLLSCPQIL